MRTAGTTCIVESICVWQLLFKAPLIASRTATAGESRTTIAKREASRC